jgi:hypothetical protein
MRRLFSSLTIGAIGAAIATLGFATAAQAQTEETFSETQVNVPAVAITCHFNSTDTSFFTFDISFVDAARGQYLLADSSHGTPSSDTEGGLLSGATNGDVLVIPVDNPAAGATALLPPKNDPFAGRRCDDNVDFGGVPGNPSRNEISGPNGLFTVNDTEVWVGDGPSRFVPGQTDSATDYINDPCNSSVRVFSLITGKQTDHINLHGCFRTDEGAFDPVDQVVLIANPSEKASVAAIDRHATRVDHSAFISLISALEKNEGGPNGNDGKDGHHAILKQINFDGTNGTINADAGIEQAVYVRQTGLFYVAIPGTVGDPNDGYLAVVDPRQLKVVQNISLSGCAPTGAALGPNETLLLGCGDQVYDLKTNTLTTIPGSPISFACDEVAYDAGSGHFGSACITNKSGGKFDLLVADGHSQQFDTELSGAFGAHSVAADPVSGTFWFPAYQGVCGASTACVAIFKPSNDSDQQGE